MALIAMAVHDTEENGRTELTRQTLQSLFETVDLSINRLIIIDNGSCEATQELFKTHRILQHNEDRYILGRATLIKNESNVGTAKAINQAWHSRTPKEHLIKMDNDVVVHSYGWVEELEEAIERDPSIGILGLKRKDLLESPDRSDGYKSTLRMLPHKNGERWIVIEEANHVMGTCQMFNHRLIDKIGGLCQMDGLYGFDDTLASVRAHLSGFKTAFLPHIEIDHIDPGGTPYTEWKRKYAGEMMSKFYEAKEGFANGTIPIYVPL